MSPPPREQDLLVFSLKAPRKTAHKASATAITSKFFHTTFSMKQTNNAIKFLMAQYRAIFKNAYFKGLATAALVTAGLAVGAAQAETVYLPGSDGHTITDSHASQDIIVTGTKDVLIANQSTSNSSKASSILVQDGTLTNAHATGNYLAVKKKPEAGQRYYQSQEQCD